MKKKFLYSEITEIVNPDDVDLTSFELKNELNPLFWEDGRMDLYVRRNLLRISRDFIEDLDIEDVPVEDIIMTGSLANYNWNEEYSDIDLHIIVDFDYISKNTELVENYFDAVRKSWNQKHENIRIYDYPVEIYVQNVGVPHTSTGYYSVLFDKWIEKPSKSKIENKKLKYDEIKEKVSEFMNMVDELEEKFNRTKKRKNSYESLMNIYEEGSDIFNKIKRYRRMSLSGNNKKEMTEGNLIFKTLRRNGYIEKLVNIKRDSYDLANSI